MAFRSSSKALVFFAVAYIVVCCSATAASAKKPTFYTFCVWDAFSRWRPAPHNFSAKDIPAELCDAVIYSHVTIDNETGAIKLTEKELSLDPEARSYSKSFLYNPIWMLPPHRGFRELSELKKRNPKLKLLLGIGGPHETVERYWQFLRQMHLYRDMVISISQWVKTYGLDGIVVDFFSGSRTAQDSVWTWDTAKLIHPFLWEIRQRFKTYIAKWHIILTLPAFDSSTHHLFNINRLSEVVNFFFVKSSDCQEFPKGAGLNVSKTMDMSDIDRLELIVKRGAERSRVVPEVTLSGRSYSATGSGFGRHVVFEGRQANYTKQNGFLSSFEVCSEMQSGWEQGRSSQEACPFLKKDEEYVAYEDDESIRLKAKMIMGRKYRGAVIRSVDLDDYNSQCAGKSNLLNGLRSSFKEATHDMDYPYDPPNAAWWDADISKMWPTLPPLPKPTTTSAKKVSTPSQLETNTSTNPQKGPTGKETTRSPTTAATSPVDVPASKVPTEVQSTPGKVLPAETTTSPGSGDLMAVTSTESSAKSAASSATSTESSVTSPALATGATAATETSKNVCKGVKDNTMLPHESDCSKYYHCVHSTPYLKDCAPNTIFDIERQTCNWPAITNRPECKLS
ncbi:endochitinase-like isoform X1 [Dermacentor albipictus]|uniref:endochitinase-like isoform X1 n=2 Tax=Dermacentor albipictus TaxID=60249 RepID=UPI0038FBEEE8